MRRQYLLLCLAYLARPLWAQSTTTDSDGSAATTSTESSAASSTTSSGAAATHTIKVGAGGQHRMSPDTVTANVGDTIEFVFFPTNHSIVRSEYTHADTDICADGCNPCVPYELYYPEEQDKAFFSGNRDVASTSETQSWTLTVNDTDPIWFYCDATNSCSPNAMVGVINPGSNQSIDAQYTAAKHAAYQLAPGEEWPAEGGGTDSSSDSSSSHKTHTLHLSGGAIAGIVVGIVVFLGLCAALAFFIGRSRAYGKVFKNNGSSGAGSQPAMSEAGYNHVPGPGAANPWFQQQALTSAPDRVGSPPLPSPPLSSPQMGFPGSQDPKHMSVASFNPQRWSDSTGLSQVQRGASPVPLEGGGTFVGYNRLTGAPEFAAEVPGDLVMPPAVESGAEADKKEDKANSPVEMDARESAHR